MSEHNLDIQRVLDTVAEHYMVQKNPMGMSSQNGVIVFHGDFLGREATNVVGIFDEDRFFGRGVLGTSFYMQTPRVKWSIFRRYALSFQSANRADRDDLLTHDDLAFIDELELAHDESVLGVRMNSDAPGFTELDFASWFLFCFRTRIYELSLKWGLRLAI